MFSPNDIYNKMIECGEDYADKKAAYNALDRVTKSILAKSINEIKEGSKVAKESLARDSEGYLSHLDLLEAAEKSFLVAQVRWITLQELSNNRRTQESTRRAEMKTLQQQAIEAINNYKNNSIIMDFVTKEAFEKTASDIREKTGSGTTAKAVEILNIKNEQVQERVSHYINAGLMGCFMASVA